MRIEFHYWPGNTQVLLIDDIGDWPRVRRDFYTASRQIGFARLIGVDTGFDAETVYRILEEILEPPIIPGPFGDFNPYWSEHPGQKAKRDAQR
jgi:hypothetical protein